MTRRPTPGFTWWAVLCLLLLAGPGWAHQELLFATITTVPPAPEANEPFELRATITDSSRNSVNEVLLSARLHPAPVGDNQNGAERGARDGGDGRRGDGSGDGAAAGAGAGPVEQTRLRATADSGSYRATLGGRPAGRYRLRIVELADGGEESAASGELVIGGDETTRLELVLPPSSGDGLGAWLLWLVGLPLLAGVLITLLLLTGRGKGDER